MRNSWGHYQQSAKSLIQQRDFGTLVSRMKDQTRGGTRERAPDWNTEFQEHGAFQPATWGFKLGSGLQPQLESN
jgi:hypothetical protein